MRSRDARLTARVRELLHRSPPLPSLSEREAADRLRPHVDKLQIAPASPPPGWLDALCDSPINEARPLAVATGGRADEHRFEDAEFTG